MVSFIKVILLIKRDSRESWHNIASLKVLSKESFLKISFQKLINVASSWNYSTKAGVKVNAGILQNGP